MSAAVLSGLVPFAVVGLGAVAVMLSLAVRRSHAFASWLTLATLAGAAAATAVRWAEGPSTGVPLLATDRYALFFTGAILVSSAFVAVLAHGYLARMMRPEEFYVLLLTATLGATVLASANDMVTLFLGLELLSVSLYALLAYPKGALVSGEAGLKYLVLASVSGAVIVLGIGFAYYATGSTAFARFLMPPARGADLALWWTGILLVLAGLGFELALVPFHMWTADVYQGAPVPSAAFVATAGKGAALAVLFRIAATMGPGAGRLVVPLAVLAGASILGGNLLALLQTDVKRLLGYSSIAHMGYLMVPVIAGGVRGASATAFYFAAYAVTILAAFGVLSVLRPGAAGGPRGSGGSSGVSAELGEASGIDDLRGLARRHPVLAALLTLALFSLAGIPLTAGFVGKVFVVIAGTNAALWPLLLVMAVGTTIGLYYYLRAMLPMFERVPQGAGPAAGPGVALRAPAVLALTLLGGTLLWWGLAPEALVRIVAALRL